MAQVVVGLLGWAEEEGSGSPFDYGFQGGGGKELEANGIRLTVQIPRNSNAAAAAASPLLTLLGDWVVVAHLLDQSPRKSEPNSGSNPWNLETEKSRFKSVEFSRIIPNFVDFPDFCRCNG